MKTVIRSTFVALMAIGWVKAADIYGPLPAQDVSRLPEGAQAQKTPALASEGSPALAEVQGEVESIDQQAHRLTVRDRTDKTWQVQVNPETRIIDNRNRPLKLSSLRTDDPVHVYFNTRDASARQIDLTPSFAAEALGLD